MQMHRSSLLGLCSLIALTSSLTAQGEESATLSYKAQKKWNVILPNETWTDVSGGIGIAHENGDSFAAYVDGLSLSMSVDTTGNGKTDSKVKGSKGYLVLKAKTPEGAAFKYALRFKPKGKTFTFASSGMLQAKVAGTTIGLIDQNNDGRFDEFGVDAMVVGKSRAASFLSKVVNLKGQLYNLAIEDGKVTVSSYDGEAGTLNLKKGFKVKGKLNSAVVTNDAGHSFQLAAASKGLLVPVGSYTLTSGFVSKGGDTAQIKTGKMRSLDVRLGRETMLKWGGRLIAEFSYVQEGESVKIEPGNLHFYGVAGEEYADLLPQGSSPKFFVYDETTERLLKTGRFGGC